MRIALIAPPYPLEEMPSPPLGLTYVAAAFEAAGAEVKIFDYVVFAYTKEKLEKQLESFRPDVVGATCVTMNFYKTVQILLDVKNYNPDIITIMGGPHVSFTVEETLRQYPEIDLIVIGEGEDTIAELTPVIKQRNKWRDISGIAYREGDEIVVTGKRSFIADIDRITPPARHLLPVSRYRAMGFPVSIITGRGCPYSCIFCLGRKMVGSKVRKRNTRLVLDEMETIIGYGFERINIADDLFTVDKERVREICMGIKERSLKVPWSAFSRVDTVNQEIFDLMAEAGCDAVSFGVETANTEMLKRIKKGIKLEQVHAAIEMCHKAGMLAHASFIIGLPGETKETLRETDDFAQGTKALYGYHYLVPFPGTTVRENIQDYDLEIMTNDWDRYDANDAIVRTSAMLPRDLHAFGTSYNKEMEEDLNKIERRYRERTADQQDIIRVEGQMRMYLTYQVLKEDVVEKIGFIEPDLFKGSKFRALQELCRRVKEYTKSDEKVTYDTIRDFEWRGYLVADISEKGCQWSWATLNGNAIK